jgi:hypothetical protein
MGMRKAGCKVRANLDMGARILPHLQAAATIRPTSLYQILAFTTKCRDT